MAADAVRRHVLVDLAEHQVRLGFATRPGDAGLGIDHEVVDQAGASQRSDGEDRRGRVAAGRADDGDGRIDQRLELGAMELGQAVDGTREEVRMGMLEPVPARVVGLGRGGGNRGRGR